MEANIPRGFILIRLRTLESKIMKKPPIYFKAWMLLLLEARHNDRDGLKRGELFTSIPILQEKLSYHIGYRKETPSKKQIRGVLEWLGNHYEEDAEGNNEGPMIVTKKVAHGMVVAISNYDDYLTHKKSNLHDLVESRKLPFELENSEVIIS